MASINYKRKKSSDQLMISLFISDLRAKKEGREGGSQILIALRSCKIIGDLFLIPVLQWNVYSYSKGGRRNV